MAKKNNERPNMKVEEPHRDYENYLLTQGEFPMQNGLGMAFEEPDESQYNEVCAFPYKYCGDCPINVVCLRRDLL